MRAFSSFEPGFSPATTKLVFDLKDIVAELPVAMEKFYSDPDKRTCKKCGAVMEPPKKLVEPSDVKFES